VVGRVRRSATQGGRGGGAAVEATQAPPKSKVVSLEKLDYFYIWRI
jgi:hypothetical protein